MRYLVTGGSGYFGEILVKKLLSEDRNVVIFDLNPPSFSDPKLLYIQGDITDIKSIRAACENTKVVYHCVAQVPIAKNHKLFWSVNCGGTENLLKAAKDSATKKIVYISSSAVYGIPSKLPVTEEDNPTPSESYGKAKYAAELLCQEYIQKGMDISIIRPRTILGHGRLGIFQILFEWIYQGYNIPVLGKGHNIYQFVHAEDLADACLAAGALSGPNCFNIGASDYGSMSEALEALINFANTRSKLRGLPFHVATTLMNLSSALGWSPLGAYHALMYGRSMYFDIGRAQKMLDFKPKYSNDRMMQESYAWYCTHRQDVLTGKRQGSKHQSAMKEGILNLIKKVL